MTMHPKLFVDGLTVIDSTYLHPTRGLVGESWIVDIVLGGELNDESMMMDFGHVKRILKDAIDNSIDHTLIVPGTAPQLTWQATGAQPALHFTTTTGWTLEHTSPAQAITVLPVAEITTEAVQEHVLATLQNAVPANVTTIDIALRTHDAGHYYHYTHGLKKHDGNCQRIAHGHRSPIGIWKNGERSPQCEQLWAQRLADSYIGTRADIQSRKTHNGAPILTFAYTAPQGHFQLTLPESRCHIIETDSTVECIASHIAQQLKAETPNAQFWVKAYEGVSKGAIAEA